MKKIETIKNVFFIMILIVSMMLIYSFKLVADNWTAISVDDMSVSIKNIESFYKNTESYSIKVSHASYKSYTTTTPEEKMDGYFIKDAKNNYHSYSMGIRTVQNSKIKLTIDSTNKSILISEPDRTYTKEVKVKELEELLKVCSKIKMIKAGDTEKFRFEFDKYKTYSTYEIWTGKNHEIEKLVLYFNAEFPSDPNDEKSAKTKPRAEITFSNYKTGIKPVYKDHFDETKYIALKNNVYVATDKYKNCTVYDLRTKK